jgi:hypothetical protein
VLESAMRRGGMIRSNSTTGPWSGRVRSSVALGYQSGRGGLPDHRVALQGCTASVAQPFSCCQGLRHLRGATGARLRGHYRFLIFGSPAHSGALETNTRPNPPHAVTAPAPAGASSANTEVTALNVTTTGHQNASPRQPLLCSTLPQQTRPPLSGRSGGLMLV